MQRFSQAWDGEIIPSPVGDYVLFSDVAELLEEAAKLRAEAMKPKAPDRSQRTLADPGGRVFGWVSPDDARLFESGKKDSCRVFKKQTGLFCMPLNNTLGPRHYQKPPAGVVVKVLDGLDAVVTGHTSAGLTVEASGLEFEVTKWGSVVIL